MACKCFGRDGSDTYNLKGKRGCLLGLERRQLLIKCQDKRRHCCCSCCCCSLANANTRNADLSRQGLTSQPAAVATRRRDESWTRDTNNRDTRLWQHARTPYANNDTHTHNKRIAAPRVNRFSRIRQSRLRIILAAGLRFFVCLFSGRVARARKITSSVVNQSEKHFSLVFSSPSSLVARAATSSRKHSRLRVKASQLIRHAAGHPPPPPRCTVFLRPAKCTFCLF